MEQNVKQAMVGESPVTLMVIREAYLSNTPLGNNWWEDSATGLVAGILAGSVGILWRRAVKAV
jgi:hypothetical protein